VPFEQGSTTRQRAFGTYDAILYRPIEGVEMAIATMNVARQASTLITQVDRKYTAPDMLDALTRMVSSSYYAVPRRFSGEASLLRPIKRTGTKIDKGIVGW